MTQNKELSILVDKTYTTRKDTLKKNIPQYIIIHTTEKNSDFESLYRLHTRIYQWKGIGYHVFISKGNAYQTRDYELEGAHCLGLNFNSIGMCIYSGHNNPFNIDLNIATGVIEHIRSNYGPLPVLSHTLAQIRYINKLSQQRGINTNIPDFIELRTYYEFLKTKIEFNDLAEKYSPKMHEYLKNVIQNFKSCPGDGFYKFIEEMNKK